MTANHQMLYMGSSISSSSRRRRRSINNIMFEGAGVWWNFGRSSSCGSLPGNLPGNLTNQTVPFLCASTLLPPCPE
jgi:hypothetical protein